MLLLWAMVFILVLQEQDLLGNIRWQFADGTLTQRSYGKEIGSIKAWTPAVTDLSWNRASRMKSSKSKSSCVLRGKHRSAKAAADPVNVLPGSLGRGSWCNEHDMIHERLDIIEEKVIKTVEHLESEVKSLLNMINETTSNIPIIPGTPLTDIFDDTS